MAPWLDHVWRKTHLDVLDSIVNRASVEGRLWAQVPSISLAGIAWRPRGRDGVTGRAPISVHRSAVSEDYESLAASLEPCKRLVAALYSRNG